MAKIMTVQEALDSIQAKTNAKGEKVINRFSKKNFNTLMTAMANDVDFTSQVAKKTGDSVELEDVMVTKEFRKWCKNLVEKAGVDKNESEIVLSENFKIDNVEGLYDFFTTALYEYLAAGNRFDLPAREDFQGGIVLKDVDESVRVYDARNPKDGTYLGTFETTKKKHKELGVKSSCPTYLSSKRQIEK